MSHSTRTQNADPDRVSNGRGQNRYVVESLRKRLRLVTAILVGQRVDQTQEYIERFRDAYIPNFSGTSPINSDGFTTLSLKKYSSAERPTAHVVPAATPAEIAVPTPGKD